MNKEEKLNIYERLSGMISKVKTIENELVKTKFTMELEKIYLDIKTIKTKYDNLKPNEEALFFQEKKQMEDNIDGNITKLEEEYDEYNLEKKSKIK